MYFLCLYLPSLPHAAGGNPRTRPNFMCLDVSLVFFQMCRGHQTVQKDLGPFWSSSWRLTQTRFSH